MEFGNAGFVEGGEEEGEGGEEEGVGEGERGNRGNPKKNPRNKKRTTGGEYSYQYTIPAPRYVKLKQCHYDKS